MIEPQKKMMMNMSTRWDLGMRPAFGTDSVVSSVGERISAGTRQSPHALLTHFHRAAQTCHTPIEFSLRKHGQFQDLGRTRYVLALVGVDERDGERGARARWVRHDVHPDPVSSSPQPPLTWHSRPARVRGGRGHEGCVGADGEDRRHALLVHRSSRC